MAEQLLQLQRCVRMNYLFVLSESVSVSFECAFEYLRFLCQCQTLAYPVAKDLHRPGTQLEKKVDLEKQRIFALLIKAEQTTACRMELIFWMPALGFFSEYNGISFCKTKTKNMNW